MNYISHLNLFGVEAKEIPCITDSGAPTTSTVGAVGLFYMNTDNGDVYKCTAVSGSKYTWEPMNSSSQSYDSPAVRIADVELLATKWVGDVSPYSQIVNIPGITEYSQVDLTPSVNQLAIFHNKDLAFVTENEDGVVTVYALGQKPENDYVIQSTITEVSV